MSFDEFFTDGDKPYAENLNDSLVLLDAFNVTVPVELPTMFNNEKFGSTVDVSRKAGVSIVTLKSADSGITIGTDSISGTGDVVFRIYPNFNSFYKWQSIILEKTGTVSVAFKTIDGSTINATVNNDGLISEASALKTLQAIDVVFTLTSATISKILINFINNQQAGRTRPNAKIDVGHISNIDDELSSSSENVVQNKVIKAALDGKADTTHSHTESDISDLGDYALSSELADVATSGSYNDLSDKPIIDGAYVHPTTKQCNYAYQHPSSKQCNYAYQHPSAKQCNATIPEAYVHPSEKQCSYAYVHPTTKQCNAPISADGYTHPHEKQCDYEYVHPSSKQCNYAYTHPTAKQCNAVIPEAYVHPTTKQCNAVIPEAYVHPTTKQCNAVIPEAYVHPSSKQCNYSYTHPTTKQCNAVIPDAYVHPSSKQCDYTYEHPASKQCSHTHSTSEISGFLDKVYPVGSIYMSVNSTNPGSLFGGSWTQLQNRFLLGAGSSYSNGATGGEATHVLTQTEMPEHRHVFNSRNIYKNDGSAYAAIGYNGTSGNVGDYETAATGGGQAHNNMPPYLVVYMWKRTG